MEQQLSRYRRIQNLLLVLCLGVMASGAIALFFLYNFGPSGIYDLKNVIISPDLMDSSRQEPSLKTFVFEKSEFSQWDPKMKKWEKSSISLENYQRLYRLLNDEKSLDVVTPNIIDLFYKIPPASLSLYLYSPKEDLHLKESKLFQEIEFSNQGDFYRVSLTKQASEQTWAYFYYPGISKKIVPMLTPGNQP